jgi:hypothetical protein
MQVADGTRPVAWMDLQPVAPPQAQQANLFPDLASNYQPDMGTESQYYFQPLTGSIPMDFLNGAFDDTADDELDNLVKGWAENASNIDVNINDITWDNHEATNPMPTEYGGGPIMDAIKQDWNSFFAGDASGAGGGNFQAGDMGAMASFPFGNMNLPAGPSLTGALPLSPVDGQQQSEPLPEAKIPDWVVGGSRPAAGGNSLPSPFNTGTGSTPSFTLSVDPSSMGWTAGGELVFDDGSNSGLPTGSAPMHQQGSTMSQPSPQSQGQQSRNASGASAGAYGPV